MKKSRIFLLVRCLLSLTGVFAVVPASAQDTASVPIAEAAPAAPATPAVEAAVTPAAAEAAPAEPAAEPVQMSVSEPAAPAPAEVSSPAAPSAEDEAAVAALLAEEPAAATDDGPSLSIYGFADASIQRLWMEEKGFGRDLNAFAPFAVGNVNAYMAANLTRGFSSLMEVRFTYLPSGTMDGAGGFITTKATETGNYGRAESWGGIVMQRVHLDYSARSWLNFRVGQFLTPYGIWNVDHGSPTIITVGRPYVIGESMFPERQTGIEIFGSRLFGGTTLGYHVTVSNGRGAIENNDFDKNKALGGRLFLARDRVGTFRIGVSAYGGRATMQPSIGVVQKDMALTPVFKFDNQYDELALAADLQWQFKNLHLQAEAVTRQVRYLESGRAIVTNDARQVVGLVTDNHSWGGYALLGYRLPWLSTMPYVIFDVLRTARGSSPASLTSSTQVRTNSFAVGLNVRPVPTVTLKAQVFLVDLINKPSDADGALLVSGQAAWAF